MQRKNVLINILSTRGGGGTTYVKNIIPELSRQAEGIQFTLLASSKYQKEIIKELSVCKVRIHDTLMPVSPLIRFAFEQVVLPYFLKKQGYDIYYQVTESCSYFAPCPVITNARNALLFLPWRKIKSRVLFLKKFINLPIALISFKKADKIICVSDSIKQSIINRYNVPQDKTRVNYHGLSSCFKPFKNRAKLKAEESPYILSVSDVMPHKNYEVLVTAFFLYLKRNPDSSLTLRIAGKPHKAYLITIKNLVISYNLEEKVRFMGQVDYQKLPQIYSQAHIFVFPSKVESFGLPLLEAMASGLPVLASDIPVFKEICSDAAVYFNPEGPDDLAEKIQLIIHNSKLRETLIKKSLKRSKDFSWKKTAANLLTIFKEVS